MKKHKVTMDDLRDFSPMVRLCGQHNRKENKVIDMIISPVANEIMYVVKTKSLTDHNLYEFSEVAYKGHDLEEAIIRYNAI